MEDEVTFLKENIGSFESMEKQMSVNMLLSQSDHSNQSGILLSILRLLNTFSQMMTMFK